MDNCLLKNIKTFTKLYKRLFHLLLTHAQLTAWSETR